MVRDEVGDRAVGVEAHEVRVLPYEGAGEQPAGKDVDPILLEGVEEAQTDLGSLRDFAQANAPELSLSSEVFAERTHSLPALATRLKRQVAAGGF